MAAVLFAPHNDDETLFAFYQVLRHQPTVIFVLRSYRQWFEQGGPSPDAREQESAAAMAVAGVPHTQWEFADRDPDWIGIAEEIAYEVKHADLVIAPMWLLGGHEDHNTVGSIVEGLEPPNVKWYATYRRGEGRATEGVEVIPTDEERALKRQALDCYESQRKHAATALWFGPDQREFLA